MNREEFFKKSGDTGSAKGFERRPGEKEPSKEKILPFEPKGNGDKPPKRPGGGAAALPVPKAAMKHEGFKSFNEWLSTRSP